MSKMSDLRREILSHLNLREEYEKFKVEFRSESPGKLHCKAIDRKDVETSAVVFLNSGRYWDSGKPSNEIGKSMSFWDFAVRYGHGFTDFNDCVRQYAKATGLWRKLPKKEQREDDRPEDRFTFMNVLETTFSQNVHGFLKRYPQISEAALIANSLRDGDRILMANYPKNNPQPQLCICLPAYGTGLLEGGPTGYVLMLANGEKIRIYKGDDAPPHAISKYNAGNGMVGLRGIANLLDVEHVHKTEGITDMLALDSQFIAAGEMNHAIITNSSGAGEVTIPTKFAHCLAGRRVYIVHDKDVAGQDGAEIWVGALLGVAAEVRNVQLPFPVDTKHGKDLRDYLSV